MAEEVMEMVIVVSVEMIMEVKVIPVSPYLAAGTRPSTLQPSPYLIITAALGISISQ